MKVKIKGLVFAGFAAAILSANAMAAGDNTVTSKSYVDSKVSESGTISSSSTTTAPNEKAVYDALALKANDAEAIKGVKEYGAQNPIQPDANGVVTLPAAQTVNDGTLTITVDGTETTFSANTAANPSVTVEYPLKGVQVNSTDLSIDSTTKKVNVTVASGANNGTIAVNGSDVSVTGLEDAAYKDVDSTISDETSTNLPTTAAVAGYVANEISDLNLGSTYQPVAGAGIKVGNAGEWDNLTASGYLTPDTTTTAGTVDIKMNSAKINNTGSAVANATSANDSLVTDYTLTGALNALPASNIPAMPTTGTNACDADHPCALVTENGAPVWKRIAQVND